jgi:hypothetical protein
MSSVHRKPQPLYDVAHRAPCPVCGHVSYSPAGIHPQCAMRASDLIQMNRLKAKKADLPKPQPQLGRFEKRCPKCRTIHHLCKQTCTCGHSFVFKGEQVPAV